MSDQRTLQDVIDAAPPERRAKIEARAAELIAAEANTCEYCAEEGRTGPCPWKDGF